MPSAPDARLPNPYDGLLPPLQAEVARRLSGLPDCHGWDHTVRVGHNARHIALVEKADLAVVVFAAWLHDIGRVTDLADNGVSCHAESGAAIAAEILAGLGVADPAFIAQVSDCVRTHRYRRRGDARPATLEARVVYDADKLDSMGAIGVGRAFHFAGRIGARVHNTEREALASSSYSREDSAYREYLVKLRHLHEAMLTGEGRRMAAGRHRFMTAFFEQIQREVEGEDY
ncbi:MAG: putative hydrolase [Lentisphaerae bacterium ADurb.BinA184]|nr:MAG: putative hydrolase [Lentisphaerae bacterium ADurb.BinA184]